MLHLREYYERALREFGSTNTGKGDSGFYYLFIHSFTAAPFISIHFKRYLFVLPLCLLSCSVELISSVPLRAGYCRDPPLSAQGHWHWDGFSTIRSKSLAGIRDVDHF